MKRNYNSLARALYWKLKAIWTVTETLRVPSMRARLESEGHLVKPSRQFSVDPAME